MYGVMPLFLGHREKKTISPVQQKIITKIMSINHHFSSQQSLL